MARNLPNLGRTSGLGMRRSGGLSVSELRSRLRFTAQVRWGVLLIAGAYASFVVLWSNLGEAIEIPLPLFLLGLPLFVLAYNSALLFLAQLGASAAQWAAVLGVLGDLVTITVLLFGTGGYGSWAWGLYPVVSLEAAYLSESGRMTLLVSALGTLAYGFVLLVQHQRWVPIVPLAFADSGPETPAPYLWVKFVWEALLAAVPALAAVASLGMLERTRASLQAAYRQLDKQYLALNQVTAMKTSFLSTISHELRTPLAVIQGYAELLEEDQGLSPESRAYLEKAEASMRSFTDKINLMIAYAALAAGEQSLDLQEASVEELLAAAAERFPPGAVELEAPAPGGHVVVDSAYMIETLVQLLHNARHINPPGVPPRLWAREEEGAMLLGVSDQGPGLPPSVREHLGEPFIGASHRMSEHQPGLGLGLAFASLVARLHGGRLGASERGGALPVHSVYLALPVKGEEGPTVRPGGEGEPVEPPADGGASEMT